MKSDKTDDLPEADLADMEFFLAQILTTLPVIGLDFFRPPLISAAPGISSPLSNLAPVPLSLSPAFTGDLPTIGITARGQEINGEFIVFKGSMARVQWEGVEGSYTRLFKELIQSGVLAPTPDGRFNLFTRDYAFSSPSAAAAVVSGRNANGRKQWRVENTDTTYAKWQEAQVKGLEPATNASEPLGTESDEPA